MNSSAKEIQMQYVSIRRVIEDANKKYKLFTGNQVEDDYLINTMQKTIIATIKKVMVLIITKKIKVRKSIRLQRIKLII